MASTDKASQPLLILFARALQAGRVKTRLIPQFGEQGALKLYRFLLTRTIAAACRFPGRVELWLDQPDTELQNLAERNGWSCHQQQGDDLGEKMALALNMGLSQAGRVLLIGSDCAVLGQEYFEQALTALETAPVVFGPLGILMGMVAVSKGERYLGMLGLTASTVLAVTGYYIARALIG